MDNGWQASANAWIRDMGEFGDFGRRYVLDPIMLPRASSKLSGRALDLGCGEGRFCRMLKQRGMDVTGIDPTPALIGAARVRDPGGKYVQATAENLPFADRTFDLVISYLSLIDILDLGSAVVEMTRVLNHGGVLLIANLNSFNTAGSDLRWVRTRAGKRLYYPIDNYLQERSAWIEYRGIRVRNHHRPLSTYMRALLDAGLRLTYFDEPKPSDDAPAAKAKEYCRMPWFLVMEWAKPA